MEAAVLRAYGAAPEYGDHPAPSLVPGSVRVRITAAPVNPLDLLCASGTSYFGQPTLPYVPGTQGVGVTDDGRRVWLSCDAGMRPGDGSMAQWCAVGANALLPLPDDVSDDLAAALGLSAIAAWMALSWRGGLKPGEHVLVLGASGTVGQVGVQAARLLGAGRVVAACRDDHGRVRAQELGADAVADLTGDDPALVAAALADATARRVDLVLDPVWGIPAEAAARVLSPRGRLVNLGAAAAPAATFSSAALRSTMTSVIGYTNNALSPEQKAAALAEILGHAAAGRITADRRILPLHQIADAWARCGQPPHRRAVMVPDGA